MALPRLPRVGPLPAWPLAAGAAAIAIFGWVRLAPIAGTAAPVPATAEVASASIVPPEPAPSDCAATSTVVPSADGLLNGLANRYADIAHGCGLGVEYPLIWYAEDAEWGAYDGQLEAGMIVCVESYVGESGGREGVKLEEPVLITDAGPVLLSNYPLEDSFA